MNNFADESSFTKFLCTIDELYIYIHRDNIEKTPYASDILISTIFLVFLVTFFKMVLIFSCFFLKWMVCDMVKIIIKLFRYKCTILWKECCFSVNYFKKIFKKIYTYNFYSYDFEVYGKFWIILIPFSYMSFIICNVIFCTFEFFQPKELDEKDYKTKNIFLIMIFFLHLFIEIYNSLFYCIKNLKDHINKTIFMYFIGCTIVFILYTCSFFVSEKNIFQLLERKARTIFLIFFICAYQKSLKVVLSYNMNKQSLKNLLEGKLEFYKSIDNRLGEEIVHMELDEIEKANKNDFEDLFKGCYSKPGKANFFKKTDRYFHRKFIIPLLIIIILVHFSELVYTLVRIFNYYLNEDNETDFIKKYREIMNFVSLVHTLIVILQSWFIFMKCEIRTLFLY